MSEAISLIEGAEFQGDVEFTPRLLATSGGAAPVALGDDSLMQVRFYEKRVPNKSKSTDKGIHFDKRVYVRIERPGDKSQVYDNPAKQNHMQRFPVQYQAFLTGKSQVNGTPIERLFDLGVLSKDQIDMIKVAGMSSVEQVAGAAITAIQGWGDDALKIQTLCKGYVSERAAIEGKADHQELAARLDKLEAENAELKASQSKPKSKAKKPKKEEKETLIIEE